MNKKLLNTQIEALSIEHGAEIVKFYKINGFDTTDLVGKGINCYYGTNEKGMFYYNWKKDERKTITLEQAKALVSTKDFSKMDMEEWLFETEKLGLSKDELKEHIRFPKTCKPSIYTMLYGEYSKDKAKILYKKWNTKNNLYTEITAYKLQDGTIVESKEDAEVKAKEMKIKNELHEVFLPEKALFIFENLELIKQIINN